MRNVRVPVVLQNELAECGLACIAMVSGAHGKNIDLPMLRTMFDPGTRGTSLKEMAQLGDSLGFSVKSMKIGLKQLGKLKLPAILHWNLVHYAVLVQVGKDECIIHDPDLGRRTISMADLSDAFSGLAQEFTPKPGLVREDSRVDAKYGWLFDSYGQYAGLLGTIFALSIVMQLFVLFVPFGVQLLLDRVAYSNDVLTVALGMLIGSVGLGLYALLFRLRSTVVLYLNNTLDGEGSQKLVSKMFSMPYDFFSRRDTGALLNRFSNLREIRLLLSQGLSESIVEAVLSIFALIALGMYLPSSIPVAIAALLLYSAYRYLVRREQQERVAEMFQTMGSQSSSLIESLQKILTVKANGIENIRESFWLSRYINYQNSVIKKLRMDYSNVVAQILCFGLAYLLTAALTVKGIFTGSLSIGEALTAIMLMVIFLGRSSLFLDRVFELLVAKVHLNSLTDIINGEPEHVDAIVPHNGGSNLGSIEVRDLGFRYSPSEPFIFRKVSFSVAPGECVALTGPSGCGKSTLLSLLLGLRSPTEGEILIDGVPVDRANLKNLRSQIGCVLQGDKLFYGSVLENVTLFELNASQEKVAAAIEACCMMDTVKRLPMQEHTMLSDAPMLSGGEVQRLLLARALYRNPRFLLLDEASSHLDDKTEAKVNSSLSASGATRLIIAHRKQTIDMAGRVLAMGKSDELGCTTLLSSHTKNPVEDVAPPEFAFS